jgi:hypothetical protein
MRACTTEAERRVDQIGESSRSGGKSHLQLIVRLKHVEGQLRAIERISGIGQQMSSDDISVHSYVRVRQNDRVLTTPRSGHQHPARWDDYTKQAHAGHAAGTHLHKLHRYGVKKFFGHFAKLFSIELCRFYVGGESPKRSQTICCILASEVCTPFPTECA